ncbi:hypothetical protein Ddye_008495 [Dipteronia dyeriana]|uniref:Retrotransposon gag domain-containing protein n=1 Tax=Dipteronia dyeriana TaxID=168575 RepID=A0AAD9X9W5_9ROSI|nr:hypothetical protein Ddye_008495 [Dipteronia dyeriana]
MKHQPSPIVLSVAARSYELKGLQIAMLPSFNGHPTEDFLQFMKDYHSILETFPIGWLIEEQLKMRFFRYYLKDRANVWFGSLRVGSLTTRDEVCQVLFNRFFSAEIKEIRIQIASFTEVDDEPFHEAYGRYRQLLEQIPPYMVTDEYKVRTFYDGLTTFTQTSVINACGGLITNKSAGKFFKIYEMLALNSQHRSSTSRREEKHEVSQDTEMAIQMARLTKQVEATTRNMGQQ